MTKRVSNKNLIQWNKSCQDLTTRLNLIYIFNIVNKHILNDLLLFFEPRGNVQRDNIELKRENQFIFLYVHPSVHTLNSTACQTQSAFHQPVLHQQLTYTSSVTHQPAFHQCTGISYPKLTMFVMTFPHITTLHRFDMLNSR